MTQELFGIKNRYISTGIVIFLSGILALSGQWEKIWLVFGAANQLVAAFALLVLTSWLLSRKRGVWYTLIPAIIMLVTATAALIFQAAVYIKAGNYLLGAVSAALLGLAGFMVVEVLNHKYKVHST